MMPAAAIDQTQGAVTRYQREAFSDVFSEAKPLLERHYAEIAHYQDIPLNVDEERYKDAGSLGNLRIYTVRKGAALIGYASFFVTMNPHYRSSKQAIQDVIYVAPEHRGSLVGYRLIRFSEDELRKDGVQVVYQHEKVRHPQLGALLKRMGYEHVDNIWGKRLDSPVRKVRG